MMRMDPETLDRLRTLAATLLRLPSATARRLLRLGSTLEGRTRLAQARARLASEEVREALVDWAALDPDLLDQAASALLALPPEMVGFLGALSQDGTALERAVEALQEAQYALTVTRRATIGANGWIEAHWIPRGQKRYGPYLVARWWEGGKKRARYLGKCRAER